eukprot:CAMPEP_0117013384 /NCGR_PEP_ID=MMETSP0472-20121206/11055_1 /TAXON_ID=693140 ORGANISM="Tiarina fusus, Strain LIS" /NCGR_SAMPLE_ID=MMETSP0472 /ASSEMBLY_ACC=CAM_ASM_000603 /LENGTH=102 /DNA_ID=CAMNT_0004716681 /DNA_START=623 /DNA_END=928 /DNA_ORIENTATION=+
MNDDTFMSSLTRSMGMVLEEFYQNIKTVGFSALTGEGVDDFFEAVKGAAEEYETEYKVQLRKRIAEQREKEQKEKEENLAKLRKDLEHGEPVPDPKQEEELE